MNEGLSDYLATLDDDHFIRLNQFTDKYHRDVYDAIKPEHFGLALKDKVVVITGASSGIGKEGIALSFAKAGAKAIYLVARGLEGLESTKALIRTINPSVVTHVNAISITNESAAERLFQQIKLQYGKADILVNCAGTSVGGPFLSTPVSHIWEAFEINLKGAIIMSQYFSKLLSQEDTGHIVNITSTIGVFFTPGTDSYGLSKLALVQLQRYIAALHPNIRATSLHPGAVKTGITPTEFLPFSKDTSSLAGAVSVWLTSPGVDFMNGRYMDVNWDVPELVSRKDEIVRDNLLVLGLQGDFSRGGK